MYDVQPPRSITDPPPRIECVHTLAHLPGLRACQPCIDMYARRSLRAQELWSATNAANRPALAHGENVAEHREGPATAWKPAPKDSPFVNIPKGTPDV
jgi:hypothetical protein